MNDRPKLRLWLAAIEEDGGVLVGELFCDDCEWSEVQVVAPTHLSLRGEGHLLTFHFHSADLRDRCSPL
jgi:hypothetical protein